MENMFKNIFLEVEFGFVEFNEVDFQDVRFEEF